jgi:hypothetical protein
MRNTERRMQASTTLAEVPISTKSTSSSSHDRQESKLQSRPAVFEITPDIINSLAAEAEAETRRKNTPPPSEEVPTSQRLRDYASDPSKKPFALHFSATPLPESERLKLAKPLPEWKLKELQSGLSLSPKSSKSKSQEEPEWRPPPRESWMVQKAALKEKFKDEAWNPRKRLSPDALAGIRAIHAQFPETYTTAVLAEKFAVSPEAIRRILKSKWTPKEEEEEDRKRRWFTRGEKVWSRYAELGMKPPSKWRKLGIGKGEDGPLPFKARKKRWDKETDTPIIQERTGGPIVTTRNPDYDPSGI